MRRRLVIVAGAMAALAAFSVVQGADHCHGGSEASHQRQLVRELSLTDEQQTLLRNIMRDTSPGREREAAVLRILTPEQQEKYRSRKDGRC